MSLYKTPGVYVKEVSTLPPSIAAVETAIPAFIGYTEKRLNDSLEAYRITSLNDFHILFGGPFLETFTGNTIEVTKNVNNPFFTVTTLPSAPSRPSFWLYYQLQMYFVNGGGPCFIISLGTYDTDPATPAERRVLIENALEALRKEDVPTLILLPDLLRLIPSNPVAASFTNYYSIYHQALQQCADLKDRFTVIDIHLGNDDLSLPENSVDTFRDYIGTNYLNYGATYYPWLESTLGFAYDESRIVITGVELPFPNETILKYDTTDISLLPEVLDDQENPLPDNEKRKYYESRSLFHIDNGAYSIIKNTLSNFKITMPPSGAIAGIYASVDNARGVFKAPANVSVSNVIRPSIIINNDLQDGLNIHPTGKSINAIRTFPGKGTLVWGARTLAGNDNEWRYVNVRRFFIFAEESIKKAIEQFVFEPNVQDTWIKVRGSIENFLTDQWKAGALAGSTTKQAFFVSVGLGETMTAQDILEGRLIVDVGMAASRPAEFIILRFTHKLQEV